MFFILSCTTFGKNEIKDKETYGKILFKSLKKKSSALDKAYISGMFKVSGVETIPSIYLKFEQISLFKEKSVSFRIISFNKPIIDILLTAEEAIVINHTNNEYVKLNIEQVDISKITGINFSPLDLSYLFLGNIPYSDSMELMKFDLDKKGFRIMDITDNVSKYTLNFNNNNQIVSVKIFNQFFDNLVLDSIKYKDDKKDFPYMFNFSNSNSTIKISFVLKNISLLTTKNKFININKLKDYTELSSLDKINIKIKENTKH